MKKFRTMMALVLAAVSLCMVTTACSDDDDDNTKAQPAAKSVEGTYKGDMTCSVMGQESTFENMTFTVTATDDATVKVTISEFGEAPMAVPSITVEGVKVSGTDGTYVLAETEASGVTSDGKNYNVTLKGGFTNNTITINFSLKYGAMPMAMICAFSSAK